MSTVWERISKANARALRAAHKALGYQVDYNLMLPSPNPTRTTLPFPGIYVMPASISQVQQNLDSRTREIFTEGEGVNDTGLDYFIVSKNTLRTIDGYGAPTFYVPTLHDNFVITGTTKPFYYIGKIAPIGPVAAGWILRIRSISMEHPKG